MSYFEPIWPTSDMDFYKINNKKATIKIRWSRNLYEDYKNLSNQYYLCGCKTFEEIIRSDQDYEKMDMWFLTGIFLVRHSIELGLKALLCRVLKVKKDIQDAFISCRHDVSMLFQKYIDKENYLTEEENNWLKNYLNSIEKVDDKSDVFRFPFKEDFFLKYKDKFLDIIQVSNNLKQGYKLLQKCFEKGIKEKEYEFDNSLLPEFFIFSDDTFTNCYLRDDFSDNFHVKVTGYFEVIDYIYQNKELSNKDKIYPLIFMFRNAIELCIKRLFYAKIDNCVQLEKIGSKIKSHLLKKDLWKYAKQIIVNHSTNTPEEKKQLNDFENLLYKIDAIDKKGDVFRYPTDYSLDYKFHNDELKCKLELDIDNVYTFLKSIINFLDSIETFLSRIYEYEKEMQS